MRAKSNRPDEVNEGEQFRKWAELKEDLHRMNRLRTIHEGEIWWCAVGKNIGIEINGKSSTFARPVLIFKKLGRFGFLGIPLTSQPHEGQWYVSFRFQDKDQIAILAQLRVLSVARLYRKMGIIDDADKAAIHQAFRELYLLDVAQDK